ncbi:PPOX class F420-dependent oxidoreductase [Cryobacterium adonitolivorans]|uniref:PPOX class F420-dependent oxidoreductase n=1 Tax=Cryobacterium adonitolivorans TaxID=1259189 RepID=A0A4R8W7P5_9MICO|nr:PPOX class F420-dependent oxidoreductase [Cryobacterium adonitolivorans]TFC01817.1 PPOX class F420-dependent oxidoreductase [Cryobacterium adonitolivorans]
MPDSIAATLAGIADERFVSLTTFRRTGEPVSTPVWIAADGADLIVTTPKESGKVKRLANDSRVHLRPCSRTGAVRDDAVTVEARAVIVDDDPSRALLTRVFGGKYRAEYRVFMFIERLGRSGAKQRVMLRINAGSTPAG